MDIMKQVDIADLISVKVNINQMGELFVDFICLEDGKQVVLADEASRSIQQHLMQKLYGKSAKDENAIGYAEEYVTKLISKLYRNGLVALDDIKESPEDPYKDFRKMGPKR